MEIIGSVKNYDWGKLGLDSEVAQLMKLNSSSFVPNSTTPYAELWLGDHPSGPAKLKTTGDELGTYINKNRNGLIGGHDKLPFLFKVLSIRKALSIQVHPDKLEAEKLHSLNSDVYKDPNHKPEMAIALTPFLGLCGFRPYKEIHELCNKFKPLRDLLGSEEVDNLDSSEGLKNCFSILMESNQDDINTCIRKIWESQVEDLKENDLFKIFSKLNEDFPNDVGILCLFFFNVIRLQPGEAIFLPANEPHAYLQGDVIECMACSDNVIRAGLTPKYKDVPTLIRLLNYEGHPAETKLFNSIKKDPFLELFIPDIKDFAIGKLCLPVSERCYQWQNNKFGCILLVLQGARTLKMETYSDLQLSRGSCIFIPANCKQVTFVALKEESSDIFIGYIAMYNDL